MDLQGSTSLDEEVAALSRGADRDSLFMQAALTIAGQATPLMVRVRNLSAGGMLAATTETRVSVAPGAAVEIDRRNVCPVAGRVVWIGDGKFGTASDSQIHQKAVHRQVATQPAHPPTLPRQRVGVGTRG